MELPKIPENLSGVGHQRTRLVLFTRHNDTSRAIDEAGLQAPWRGMSRYERDIYEKNYNLETIAVHLASISISNSEEAVGDWTGRASTVTKQSAITDATHLSIGTPREGSPWTNSR
jgi:hypothetical protein